ncbi:hypothetical protein E2C01_007697 [Portunus trituberculatus]|uniref:Uncharacterized protein n=1 Tax=Portunus trituberculatus TaxID=210409 RepID=A0A5B7D0D1_PORTR|nr:hypothetical protein [Portunus trituberculatus]
MWVYGSGRRAERAGQIVGDGCLVCMEEVGQEDELFHGVCFVDKRVRLVLESIRGSNMFTVVNTFGEGLPNEDMP